MSNENRQYMEDAEDEGLKAVMGSASVSKGSTVGITGTSGNTLRMQSVTSS